MLENRFALLLIVFIGLIVTIEGVALNCHKLKCSTYYPSSIDKVRPIDIKTIMAMGDSITAAFALSYQKIGDFIGESRGMSWVIGGDGGNCSTIPNFMKSVGCNITGQSYGKSLPYHHFMPESIRSHSRDVDTCQLNAAVSQSRLKDLVEQLEYLKISMDDMKEPINVKLDWKFLSIFIGANDICESCDEKLKTVDYWKLNFQKLLLSIRDTLPRTLVSIILLPDISPIDSLSKDQFCYKTRHFLGFCDCANTESGRSTMVKTRLSLNQIIQDTADHINALNFTDFGVVTQPALVDTTLKLDYLSKFDCFHLSEKGSSLAATAIWNNILTPKSKKKTIINENDHPMCPTEDTYLFNNN
ncbi:hypothetical protein DLAC_05746 [Tieghemostelium lacteum]|uniref:Uncharacterized protein n=1 Tax=Tieghemostelium lacteum TaxID=361077 RepID=A0A151ZGM0_TIELA|nr:hypothetical protein DLAC_05746 [Tieghemostelium lacteum]|eukprot:KYQ93121.1 hypothetical protein DLAC_05746 [Tieghemostelium lacteum]